MPRRGEDMTGTALVKIAYALSQRSGSCPCIATLRFTTWPMAEELPATSFQVSEKWCCEGKMPLATVATLLLARVPVVPTPMLQRQLAGKDAASAVDLSVISPLWVSSTVHPSQQALWHGLSEHASGCGGSAGVAARVPLTVAAV